jgi:plastocyanin
MKLKSLIFLGLAALLAACYPAATAAAAGAAQTYEAQDRPAAGSKVEVLIKDFEFQPRELKVRVGTVVTFTNKDPVSHSVIAEDKSFDTGLLEQNQFKEIRFTKAGTFKYHCGPHPSMTATITVTP